TPLDLLAVARRARGGLLLGRVKEDRRAVLAADVQALAVARRGVVDLPEGVEQLLVADARGIEPHLDGLGVPRGVAADLIVGGLRRVAARVADRRLQDPVDLAERGLHAPKAAGG